MVLATASLATAVLVAAAPTGAFLVALFDTDGLAGVLAVDFTAGLAAGFATDFGGGLLAGLSPACFDGTAVWATRGDDPRTAGTRRAIETARCSADLAGIRDRTPRTGCRTR